MNSGRVAWHRITVGLIGVILVVVGVAGVFSQVHVQPFSGWIAKVDTGKVDHAADAGWWTWILVAVVLVALVWGVRLLAVLVRPHAVDELVLDGSDSTGRMTIAPGLIADAVQSDLAARPEFDSVSAKALDDRGASIIRIVVTASPDRDYDELSAVLAESVADVRAAVDGSDVHVQAMINLAAPKK
ncbi:MAG: hypothetical protein QM658_14535 [Gordonia sp. (in: high G+C Gram-positive bacteria)]